MRRALFAIFVAFAFAGVAFSAAQVRADDEEGEFDFHIGDKFLAKFGLGGANVARAANGDTIRIIGRGEFEVGDDHDVHGRGTFEHWSATGTLFASGTWKVRRLVSFVDFGGQADLPANLHGGSAVFSIRVTAHPASNPHTTLRLNAIMTVDCAIGNVPAGLEEGTTVDVGFINFNEKITGFNVFVAEEDD